MLLGQSCQRFCLRRAAVVRLQPTQQKRRFVDPELGCGCTTENTASLLVVSYVPGDDGRYRFNRLHGEVDYTLKEKYQRYWSKRKTLSKFDSWKQR